MPNGNEFLNDMEFEDRLTELGDDQLELIKFVARQEYETHKVLKAHDKRISLLENRDLKTFSVTSGIGAIIGSGIIIASEFIYNHFVRG